MLFGYPQKYSAQFLIPLSPLWLSVVVASINLLHLDLKCVPFGWFWISVFPLNWMSSCLSVTATCRAQHLLLTTVCFIQHRYPQRVVSKLSSFLSLPFPESLSLLSLMQCIWFMLYNASSCQAWLHAQWFSKALRPTVNFKLRTCWSALLNRDQIIHVLKDKHLLKYFAEFRPKHTH